MNEASRRYVHVDSKTQALSIQTDRAPVPGAEEVLIAVDAAGINRADLLQRQGMYPPPADASPIMGLEVAGTVIACGEAVTQWQIGTKVCALTNGGGYASHAIAPQGQCLPIPRGYSMSEAAALPEALLTVWHNVFQRARLAPDERILVHGGASGIGTLAVAICRAWGAEVFSTAGTDEKCQRIEALGASRAFNYRTSDFVEELDALGMKNRINVILDMVGGDFVQKNLDVAAPEGRIVNIAYLRGFTAEVNFLPLLIKRLTLSGSTLRAQSERQKAQMVVEILEHVFAHLDSGKVKPVIDSEFTLDDVEEAQARMQSGEHMGKILLRP